MRLTPPLFVGLLVACGRGAPPPAPSCGPLIVSVDGVAVDGLSHGLAFTARAGALETLTVQLSNRADLGCADLAPEAGRLRSEDERTLEAFVAPGPRGSGLGLDDYKQLGVPVERAPSAAAPREGEEVSVCVPDVTFVPVAGRHADRKVRVAGRLAGRYCGVRTYRAPAE